MLQLGVSLNGKIVLCRYGAVFRGDKVQMAEDRGAIGVIIYSDPFDYVKDNNDNESSNEHPHSVYTLQTFPERIWMPPSGAQRGTLLKTDGDPETPFLPSKHYAYRSEQEQQLRNTHIMPNVPVMPIGYRDAIKVMQKLDGPTIPWSNWKGGMNTTYRLTGSRRFRLSVHAITTRRTITNVIATMRGAEEPDRYVLFGNHVDAWVQGAIDPNSGTATLLEMARVLANISHELGWRPRRTIMFCQWDAEEFGLIGSSEWVEELMKPLQQRAVALINVDNINGNTTLSVKAVPLLYRAIVDAAAKTPTPSATEQLAGRLTILDSWRFYDPKGPVSGDKSIPGINIPGSGSDFQRFISYLGVPIADIKFECAPIYSYMVYHSMYEIPWTVENFVDKDFAAMRAVGRLWLELGRNLADSVIIPFNVLDYSLLLDESLSKMGQQLEHVGVQNAIGKNVYTTMMGNLKDAMRRFQSAAETIQHIIHSVNRGQEAITLRQAEMLNNRLQNLERAFIFEQGIYPERAQYRHLVFTTSEHNDYGGVLFAGIMDPAIRWRNAFTHGDLNGASHWLETIKIGFTKLQYAIESGILILNLQGFYD
ncbi:Glutamate carboxypeptidase 2 -like protein [Toxocara canis]|uniref:Glutamate carboxypeptidase 2-like protein n=1 Tax=Toxocara canis TaxID=6265 RepID=A0A0B2VSB3_TOXCA|nr:Glutamate carboxypeptidase 2 -like protein [Toxocara canis]